MIKGSPDNLEIYALFLPAFFILLFSIMKVILMKSYRGFKDFVTSFFVSFPVGFLIALVAIEQGVGDKTSIAIGCFTALVSDKLVLAILETNLSELWSKILHNLIDKYTK